MKWALLVFLILCSAFGILGWVAAVDDYSGEEPLVAALATQSKIMCPTEENHGECALLLEVDRKRAYAWRVDSNELQGDPDAIRSSAAYTRIEPKFEGLWAFFAGAAAGETSRQVGTALLRPNHPRKKLNAVAAILGAISGYSLGYKMGSLTRPDISARKYENAIVSRDTWMRVEAKAYSRMFWNAYSVSFFQARRVRLQDPPSAMDFIKKLDEWPLEYDPYVYYTELDISGRLRHWVLEAQFLALWSLRRGDDIESADLLRMQRFSDRVAAIDARLDTEGVPGPASDAEMREIRFPGSFGPEPLTERDTGNDMSIHHKYSTDDEVDDPWWFQWWIVILLPVLAVVGIVWAGLLTEKRRASTETTLRLPTDEEVRLYSQKDR